MEVRPLHNEQDYDWAIREIARYFEVDPVLGTADGDRFEVLSILIKDYEDKHFAMSHGDPVDVIRFAIESMGCLLYTSPSPRDGLLSRMPSSA